jgi:hypothetical protein
MASTENVPRSDRMLDPSVLRSYPVGMVARSWKLFRSAPVFNRGWPKAMCSIIGLLLPGFFVGPLIAWKRPTDAIGRMGAWFAITTSIAFGFPIGWAPVWRALPTALQLLLWIPELSRFVLEAISLAFL